MRDDYCAFCESGGDITLSENHRRECPLGDRIDRIAELEAQVRERDGLLRQVLDPDDCRLDHHGFCQTHGWMDRSGCPHARIRSLIGGAK